MKIVIKVVCYATHYPYSFSKSFFGQSRNGTDGTNRNRVVVNSNCDLTPNIEIQFKKATIEC